MRKSIKGLGISTIAKTTLMKVMGFTVNTVGIYQMMTKANGW